MRPGDIEGARKARLPRFVRPQLATLTSDAPEGDAWLHEMKVDGYRILCRIDRGDVRLLSRNEKDWTSRYPEVVSAAKSLSASSALLDGEVVVLDERGVSDFQALQNALRLPAGRRELHYIAFDLLHLDGWDLTQVPLLVRKDALGLLIGDATGTIRYSDHVVGHGPAFHAEACRLGLEGIIAKRADRPYSGGRGRDWLKIKCVARQEFVVVGFTDPSGSRVGFGSLLLAVNDAEGRLTYAGRVGAGFGDATLRSLHGRLKRIERKDPAVHGVPRGAKSRDVHWTEPRLVAEVRFTEWTSDGAIRHPSFQGLREDKKPADVVREATGPAGPSNDRTTKSSRSNGGRVNRSARNGKGDAVEIEGVRLTSPDRIVYPDQGITKRALADYWVAVASWAIPHLKDRPLTLVRCPAGASAKCFFQKHANEGIPDFVPRIEVPEKEGTGTYASVRDVRDILALVQLGVLEFHVSGARADRLDRPDRLVLDLDPDAGLAWEEVARAALELRDVLEELGLASFLKTTGGKGLHLVVPIERRTGWEDALAFTRAIAERMAEAAPKRFTAVMSKSRRKGRIYIDFLRNAPNATAVAAFSTRARAGAPVSVPLSWGELSTGERPSYTIDEVPARLAALDADPWQGFDAVRQSLTKAILARI